jgi:uncharacterized protein (TIGR01440 family)
MENYDILAPIDNFDEIKKAAADAAAELCELAGLKKGDIFVVGCSSSEITGKHIGKFSAFEAARAVFEGIYPVLSEKGTYLAAQCCEHLNRALIIERSALKNTATRRCA